MFRLISYVLLAYFVYSVWRLVRILKRGPGARRPRPDPRPGVMVQDETCHLYLPKSDALREVVGGKEYFFCSKECRKAFLESRKRD
jgi:YHS domain-containing protein